MLAYGYRLLGSFSLLLQRRRSILHLSSSDWNFLGANSYGRMRKMTEPYGVLLEKTSGLSGTSSKWLQPNSSPDPLAVPLHTLTLHTEPTRKTYCHKATDRNGHVYLGRKALDLRISGIPSTLWIFDSPQEAFCISSSSFPMSSGQHSLFEHTERKGHLLWDVDPDSVAIRTTLKRTRSQRQVMGQTAHQAYQNFLQTHALPPHEYQALFRGLNEYPGKPFRDFQPEWCHLYGYQLSPLDKEPQCPTNLGAAPRWWNNEMFICEKVLGVLALAVYRDRTLDLKIQFSSTFWVLDRVALQGLFITQIQKALTTITTFQELHCHQPLLFRRSSDSTVIAQLIVDHVNAQPWEKSVCVKENQRLKR